MRTSYWKIWTKTNTEKKAREMLTRVLKRANREGEILSLEPYPKINGHVIRFAIELKNERWNDQVVEAIQIGQSIASHWALTGNITDDPGGSSSTISDSGVESIEWSFR